MISVYINDVAVDCVGEIIYTRNRKSGTDFGSITVVNTRTQRYEPYSRVLVGTEQYLIESDNPLQLRSGLVEHYITLVENIAILATIFPVDRQFTTVPSKTIGNILQTYKEELYFYQGFSFDFDTTDTIYTEPMVNKRYAGVSFAVIIYDLFRKINAIPRVTYDGGIWELTYELYTKRNNLIVPSSERTQNKINDIDYATQVLSKSHNVVSESRGIWYPSKTTTVNPRTKSTMLQTSDWIFEFDSHVNTIYQGLIKNIDCVYFYEFEGVLTEGTITIDIDFTGGIRLKDDYDTLAISSVSGGNPIEQLTYDQRPQYKQNNIYYETGNNIIEGLFWTRNGVIFTQNIVAFSNLVKSYAKAAIIQALDGSLGDISDWRLDEDFFVNMPLLEDAECQFYYRPERDVDFMVEKRNVNDFNKVTILNQQKDSSAELARFIENQSAVVERVGNNIINITQNFDTVAAAWQLGDYYIDSNNYWIITDIRYTVYKTLVQVVAEFNKNFSNTNRESAVTRDPSAFVYTGRSLQSNFILKDYLSLALTAHTRLNDSLLLADGRRTALNLIVYDGDFNKPITNATYRRMSTVTYIDMPIYSEGQGNAIVMHGQFMDARIAGNGMQKIGAGWYKKPVYYVNNDFVVEKAEITFNDTSTHLTDTDTLKYYPEVAQSAVGPFSRIMLPIVKDPNDTLAVTYELITVVDDDRIVVANGFSKLNNLIREFDTAPTIKLYSDTEPYTIFDKRVHGTEISGSIDLQPSYIEVLDALDDPIDYWAIVVDDEIILAGNGGISKIYYAFYKSRDYGESITDLILSLDMIESDYLTPTFVFQENEIFSAEMVESDVITATFVYRDRELVSGSMIETDLITTTFAFVDNTLEPTVSFISWTPSGSNNIFRFLIRNNDASTATIYADNDDAAPSTSRGSVLSGSSVTVDITTSLSSYILYARALAIGKNYSTVDSATGSVS